MANLSIQADGLYLCFKIDGRQSAIDKTIDTKSEIQSQEGPGAPVKGGRREGVREGGGGALSGRALRASHGVYIWRREWWLLSLLL